MLREACRIGMKVRFGKANGEVTRGVVTKLNPKTAAVQTTDSRGRHAAGEVWRVAYEWLFPDDGSAMVNPQVEEKPLNYHPFDSNNPYYELLVACYNNLSPEWLTCDGEASMQQIQRKRSDLNRRIRGLCHAIGRTVSENQIWDWLRSKEEYQKANPDVKMAFR